MYIFVVLGHFIQDLIINFIPLPTGNPYRPCPHLMCSLILSYMFAQTGFFIDCPFTHSIGNLW